MMALVSEAPEPLFGFWRMQGDYFTPDKILPLRASHMGYMGIFKVPLLFLMLFLASYAFTRFS